jgi:hypothetical protein
MGEWCYPFSRRDLCYFVKSYLDKKGATTRFKDNLPTRQFVDKFLRRHKVLRLRTASNIKRSRAQVSRDDVTNFISKFEKSVEGVPPENIFNYDETNLRDDPGNQKCLFKKGTKYCERVINTSKQSTSVMFCGSAAGQLVPPMVAYRAQNLYTSWCERGPKGAVYAVSKSGWFDGCLFERWFFDLMLPILKRKEGKTVLLGDNLSSHISMSVIEACRANNIAFICLPPNATDKLQPLDVGVFGPLKKAWRAILSKYKAEHPKEAGINKSHFPALLKNLLDEAQPGRHLPAAFMKCGLVPVDAEKAVQRIPSRDMQTDSEVAKELLSSSLGERLEQLRGFTGEKKKQRGKKIKVPAGQSYCPDDGGDEDGDGEHWEEDDDEEEGADDFDGGEDEDNDVEATDDSENEELPSTPPGSGSSAGRDGGDGSFPVGSFVVAIYDDHWYIAQVESEEPEEEIPDCILLKYMIRKGNNQFLWDEKVKDILRTDKKDIIMAIDPPIPVSNRYWGLPKEKLQEVLKHSRVNWSIISENGLIFSFSIHSFIHSFSMGTSNSFICAFMHPSSHSFVLLRVSMHDL